MNATRKKMMALILALSMALSLLTACQSASKEQEEPVASASEGSAEASASAEAVEGTDYQMDGDVIVAYVGSAHETTTPKNAVSIGSDAFSWDMGYGEELEKVTVTSNIKRIESGAFSFTAADFIYIEEGVEYIGHSAFSDSYIDEIWFPSSVTEIGASIMMTEEGLEGTKIHLVEGSPIAKYFEEDMPYGQCELLYDYQ